MNRVQDADSNAANFMQNDCDNDHDLDRPQSTATTTFSGSMPGSVVAGSSCSRSSEPAARHAHSTSRHTRRLSTPFTLPRSRARLLCPLLLLALLAGGRHAGKPRRPGGRFVPKRQRRPRRHDFTMLSSTKHGMRARPCMVKPPPSCIWGCGTQATSMYSRCFIRLSPLSGSVPERVWCFLFSPYPCGV